MSEGKTHALSGALTVATIGRLWKQQLSAVRSADRISLAAVTEIDSAGVAMVRSLQREGGRQVTLVDLPERFEQICLAHRIDAEGH